ncbi:hypothetical protein INR49_012051 [Caranx melampygus]|nr:hypothetical protein INR49_012051 [Caranx melampygus]
MELTPQHDMISTAAGPETLKPSSGTAAPSDDLVKGLLVSVTAALGGAEWSFSASEVAGVPGESGAEASGRALSDGAKPTGRAVSLLLTATSQPSLWS